MIGGREIGNPTRRKHKTGILLEHPLEVQKALLEIFFGDFLKWSSGPVAKIPRSQCRRPGFDPWSGN